MEFPDSPMKKILDCRTGFARDSVPDLRGISIQ